MTLAEAMSLGDKINLGVAGATFLLAVATIVLALYTRKSVTEAAQARRVWASMALDATRARMDQAAPQVAIEGATVPLKLYAFSRGATSNTYTNEWPQGHTWVFDKNATDIICIKLLVNVVNGSSLPVHFACIGDFYWNSQRQAATSFVVPAGNTFQVQMQATLTVKQWSDNYQARLAGEPIPYVVTSKLIMVDRSENGVNDEWELTLSGWPIEQVPGNIAEWRVGPRGLDGATEYSISPRRRIYFLSRSAQFVLPSTNSVAEERHEDTERELRKARAELDNLEVKARRGEVA